jgi:hypothetical protein
MTQGQDSKIRQELWQALERQAATEGLSPETWLERRLAGTQQVHENVRSERASDSEDEALLQLALAHFHNLQLSGDEACRLGDAIFDIIDDGEAKTVGPVGAAQRRYTFQRRVSAISICLGEGRIRLPLKAAARLATALTGTHELARIGQRSAA